MKRPSRHPISIEIDKLTNSIEHLGSGKVFRTLILPFTANEKNYRKREWVFDWKRELNIPEREVYKLALEDSTIHGLISLTDNVDHVFINLVEVAKFNRGKSKTYSGVAGNLFAFACKLAFAKGYDGVVVFDGKSKLIAHYKDSLGAQLMHGTRMFIDTNEARQLTLKYFREGDRW
ncbi:MAG: hypothetical protein AAB209_04205 [Bacteroidota bacterium]